MCDREIMLVARYRDLLHRAAHRQARQFLQAAVRVARVRGDAVHALVDEDELAVVEPGKSRAGAAISWSGVKVLSA